MDKEKTNISKMEQDIMRPAKLNLKFHIWMLVLTIGLGISIYAYIHQLNYGLGVTGMRDYVSWGMYIANFVFFVAASLVGMLISSVLGLSGAKWTTSITRIAEIIAVAFAMVAGIVIIVDMGRPDRVFNLLLHGRIQSPIVWDVVVVTTYVMISLLLLYIPLIPDISRQMDNLDYPKWQRKFYKILSIGWADRPEQFKIIKKTIRILLILIIPVALAIHTVTSWLFASTLRHGWDSTIFGPGLRIFLINNRRIGSINPGIIANQNKHAQCPVKKPIKCSLSPDFILKPGTRNSLILKYRYTRDTSTNSFPILLNCLTVIYSFNL